MTVDKVVSGNGGSNVKNSHPERCWVIRDPKDSMSISVDGKLLIFSEQKKASDIMKGNPRDSYVLKEFSWDDLVDNFRDKGIKEVIVDYHFRNNFYWAIPLVKGKLS